jgi:hypothetical protein
MCWLSVATYVRSRGRQGCRLHVITEEIHARYMQRLANLQQEAHACKLAAAEAINASRQAATAAGAHASTAHAAATARLDTARMDLDADKQQLQSQLSLLSREHHATLERTKAAILVEVERERARAQRAEASVTDAVARVTPICTAMEDTLALHHKVMLIL